MVLLGIDSQSVYVNDPGRQFGTGVHYPLSNFVAAWLMHHNSGVSIHASASVNPTPNITSLQPGSLPVDSAQQAIAINGTGFLATSAATFNGVAHAATYVSAGQLTITLTTTDLETAGSFPVVVTNPAPGAEVRRPSTSRSSRTIQFRRFFRCPPLPSRLGLPRNHSQSTGQVF